MTTMTLPPIRNWNIVKQVIDSNGLTFRHVERGGDSDWVIQFKQNLTAAQKSALRDAVIQAISGVSFS